MIRGVFKFIIILFCIAIQSCKTNLNSSEKDNTFFPLNVGAEWKYKMVDYYKDAPYPNKFTVKVVGTKTVNGVEYFAIENYFLLEFLPNPALIRVDHQRVFLFINGEDFLLYSFNKEDSTEWSFPSSQTKGDSSFYHYFIKRDDLNANSGKVCMALGIRCNRAEGYLVEKFSKGLGREEILLSLAIGKNITWKLL